MSGVWLYLLGLVNLAVGLYSLVSSFYHLQGLKRLRSDETEEPCSLPWVALLVPCCGYEEGLEDNLGSLFRQDYPRLRLVLIVESETDASLPVIRKLAASQARPAQVVVAGEAAGRGQKVHNLLAGLPYAQGAPVLAFADSDCRAEPHWLARLVAPLQRRRVGVTTGYRFYLPDPPSFASYLRSVWNSGVLTLLGDHNHNFAWGGSMAIRNEVFREARVKEAWQGALSDDYALTHAVRRAGYKVHFVPSCIMTSAGHVSLGEVLRWSERQISITHVYWRNLWQIGGGTQLLYSIFFFAGTAAAVAGDAVAGALLGAVLLLGGLSGGIRCRAIQQLGPQWRKLRGHGWAYVFLAPLVGFLTTYGLLRSAVSRRVQWRGKTYVMRSPTETVVVRPERDHRF